MLGRSLRETARPESASEKWRERVAAAISQEAVRSAFSQVVRDLHWLNRHHVAVCRIPAPTFREAERAEYLKGLFAELGHRPKIDAAGNVVVPLVYRRGLPFIAVTAHMDTTIAPSRPRDIRIGGNGTMHGPGVTDNGTGLTALLALARLLSKPLVDRPTRNVVLIANVAEEGEGNLHGIRYVTEHSRYADAIDRYLVVDGASLGHITSSALGSKRFELLIRGRGGHSWNDFGRANPIHALGRAIAMMTHAELPSRPKATISVGIVHGGTSVNAIPTLARAKIDVRSADARQITKAANIVEQSARIAVRTENRNASDRLTAFELREIGSRPAAPALELNPVADCFQAVDGFLGIPSTLDCASTDANVPLAAGIPTVAVGSGGRGGDAHAPSEWYDPQGRDLGLRRLILGIACLQSPLCDTPA